MTPTVALDLTRLALGPARLAPRGIDRVEIAYARHFLNKWPGECVPVLPMPWGVRTYERRLAIEGLAELESLWRETLDPLHDADYLRTKSFLAGQGRGGLKAGESVEPKLIDQIRRYVRLLSATGIHVGSSVARTLPQGSIYLNVGQLEIFRPALSWLKRRPDINSVFMIHDLIPLEFPDHHIGRGVKLHQSIVRNTAEFAHSLIVPSQAVRESVVREMSKFGRAELPVHVEHLPVPTEFVSPVACDPELRDGNYFIICGALDSYKNHMLLLEVWQKLAEHHGPKTPKLVIAGAMGVTGERVVRFIGRNRQVRNHVILSTELATQALRQLMIGARALLMPSLAEGFGLPIIESLAQGTPVVASDIPTHREAGKDGDVTYLPPHDVEQWLACIETLTVTPKLAGGAQAKTYRAKSWEGYFRGIEKFLAAAVRAAPG